MMAALFLGLAIACELCGTLSLRMATDRSRLWFLGVGVGYLAAMGLLVLTLREGMPLGVAYGLWAAIGVALTAILGRILFNEPFTWVMGLGIVLIAAGVLLIEVGAH